MPPPTPRLPPPPRDAVTSGARRREQGEWARVQRPRATGNAAGGCLAPRRRSAVRTGRTPGQDGLAALGADIPGPFSSLEPGPGRAFGKMFPPPGRRRGCPDFPREPDPWRAGPPLPCAHSPRDVWDRVPWEHRHRRRSDGRRPDNIEEDRGPKDCFRECLRPPGPWDPRPFPGPADFPWSEEERRWEPCDRPPPPHWDNIEEDRGPECYFREDLHPELLRPDPSRFAWPEFHNNEQHPPWPPASLPGERDGLQDGCLSWDYPSLGGKGSRRFRHLRPSRAPSSDPSLRGLSPARCCRAPDQCGFLQSPLAVNRKVPEPPRTPPADTPPSTPAAGPRAVTEAVEPEQTAEAKQVKPGARQEPANSHGQSPPALKTESASPENSSAGTGKHLEVEPCSQSVPEAGAGGGSRPHSPTAPPVPAKKVCTAASSAGEAGAELCPCSRGQQHLPSGAGEADAEAACDGPLSLPQPQPSKISQVLPGATAEPNARPSQACLEICTTPGTQHPPGSSEMEPAARSQHRLCPTPPTPSQAIVDLRSAAVLARKAEIELSYQQFSLTIAVVATMLLQKEPSMEAALGLALRDNLRQGSVHHLQELADFIDSYDSATLSR
ncbi:LOW QUALITY PROTEIN: uncharacterized protein FYN16_011991 [Cariama cristata]